MRKKIEVKTSFFLNTSCDQKVVAEYQNKYNHIDRWLDSNPSLLDSFHEDLMHFGKIKGRESRYSSEQTLRMIIVKFVEQLSYRDLIIRVAESDFLRNFTRIGVARVMNYSFVASAFKAVRPETWEKINQLQTTAALSQEKISGTHLRLDSTVQESNIHFPTDCSLLLDSYRVVARMIRQCNDAEPLYNCGFRFHDKKIKKLHTYISTHGNNKARRTKRKVKTLMHKLIQRLDYTYDRAIEYIAHGRQIRSSSIFAPFHLDALEEALVSVRRVIDQAYRSQVLGETVPASERLFSIFEEHTELIKRGKAGHPVEFGHLVSLGQTKEKYISFYHVAEKSPHDTQVKDEACEHHKKTFGKYPDNFAADKNYYVSMDDIREWEKKIGVYSICKKGTRTAEENEREHTESFSAMQRFRAGIEGSISVLKRAFGLRRCLFSGFKSFAAGVGCLVFCHNLVLLARL